MSSLFTRLKGWQKLSGSLCLFSMLAYTGACKHSTAGNRGMDAAGMAHLPLVLIQDVDLPGGSTRFDYHDTDLALGRLVIAHMNDDAVIFVNLADGSTVKQIAGIATARGIAVADDVGLVFVTASPDTLVLIDNQSMNEVARVTTGDSPDGVAWDPSHKIVGVSDQGSGSLSLLPNAGQGLRQPVALGADTGNVVFDSNRGWFWITVVQPSPPDQLVAVDPLSAQVQTRISLPGGSGAHGLLLHPDGHSAFVACESNNVLLRVDLASGRVLGSSSTGRGPDVMSIDPDLGWLYLAAEDGNLTVVDLNQAGVGLVGRDRPGDNAHTVSVDPKTHRVFFPLMAGPKGTPVLRIMRPGGGSPSGH